MTSVNQIRELLSKEDFLYFQKMYEEVKQPRKIGCAAKFLTKEGWKTLVILKDDNANISLSLQKVR